MLTILPIDGVANIDPSSKNLQRQLLHGWFCNAACRASFCLERLRPRVKCPPVDGHVPQDWADGLNIRDATKHKFIKPCNCSDVKERRTRGCCANYAGESKNNMHAGTQCVSHFYCLPTGMMRNRLRKSTDDHKSYILLDVCLILILFEFRVSCHDGEVEQRNRNEGSLGQIHCQDGVDGMNNWEHG